jgi:formate dehydrogenase major subunit
LRPGTNIAVLDMMLYYIIKDGMIQEDFIEARTEGYEEFKRNILKINLDDLEAVSGVPREQVRAAAKLYAAAPKAMLFHGLGVTEHYQGTYTVMQIANLAMITGNVGKPGCGVNPLRGQNNVQGMADMGVQPYQGAGYYDVTLPEVNQMYNDFYGVKVPQEAGLKIPQMYDAAIEGKFKALWIMGDDLVQSDPNTNHVLKAIKSLDLLIVQEIFMTETAKHADVILPAASFLEKEGTFTNGERRIQRVNKVVEPIGECKADGQIMVDIMNRMGYKQAPYAAKTMLEEISQIVPFFAGVKWDELGEQGKQWPVAADGTDTKILHTDTFKRGKGRFQFREYVESPEILAFGKDYPYILTTNRVLEHYNAGTMTRRTPNAEIVTEDVVIIHPDDAAQHHIGEGDWVCIESDRGKVDIKARISDEVKPGVISTTFHFPELLVNIVTSSVSDSEAKCPEFKVVAVRIRKARRVADRHAKVEA